MMDAKETISDETMVNTKLGLMMNAYCEQKQIPKREQTWNQWKRHCNDVINELKGFHELTTTGLGFGINVITMTPGINEEITKAFDCASIQKLIL